MTFKHFNLSYENNEGNWVSEDKIQEWGKLIFAGIGAGGAFANLLLCDSNLIQKLNREHLGKDRVTDVLSWSYYKEPLTSLGKSPLGEMAICQGECDKQARENGWAFEVELARLVVHGMAHIIGFDHDDEKSEKDMLKFEKQILDRLSFPNVYG